MWETIWSVLLDSLIDSAKVLPFLFVIYILIELLENSKKAREKTVRLLNGKLAPLVASGVGIVPQCGFSVMAADLFSQNFIRCGTLVALFIATSDEALPLLLTNEKTIGVVWIVILVKIVFAIAVGYVVNLFDKRQLSASFELGDDEGCCHHDIEGEHKHGFWNFIQHPIVHTLKIFAYLLAVNIVFGLLLAFAEEGITTFMNGVGFAQPFFAAAIGLIPNCGSSVVLVGMYSEGILNFGSMCAGLIANSGIALAVLFKDRKQIKRNLVVTAILYGTGVVAGLLCVWLLPV